MLPARLPAHQFALLPIGRVRTPWSKGDCPKNMMAARETGRTAVLIIDPQWRDGLVGLARASHAIILGWFVDVDRDVLVQHPAHLTAPQGCFSLRTPARPNPIGLSIVRIMSVGQAAGLVTIDALDWFDGTPILDIKPYLPTTDMIADATVAEA